jgi:tetratricopeptide (TPR) repeat protein
MAALAFATSASAGGIDDGNAGLAALKSGDNDAAINLFTRALGSRDLKGDDREFAYANRGQAYLNKVDYPDAIADLDKAREMKPDDTDAQTALLTALSSELPANLVPGQSAKTMVGQFGRLLGKAIVNGMAQGAQGN